MADPSDVALLRQYRSAAISALATGDYDTALQQALAAQLLVATIPSALSRSAGTGGGSQSVSWASAAIDQFIIRVRQMQAAALGIQSRPIVHAAPLAEDAY